MRRITLPGDHWADLREPATHPDDMHEQLTTKGRRGILVVQAGLSKRTAARFEALQKIPQGPEQVEALQDLWDNLPEHDVEVMMRANEAVVAALVLDWDLDEPLPTATSVADLPTPIYDALALAVSADTAAVMANASLDTSPTAEPDPKGRTGRSKTSAGASKDV